MSGATDSARVAAPASEISRELASPGRPRSRTPDPRFASIEDLIARTGLRRDELATLAEIGALNAFGYDRRSALWQIERAVAAGGRVVQGGERRARTDVPSARRSRRPSPLRADDAAGAADGGLCRHEPDDRSASAGAAPAELALRGVLRASDLPRGRHGRRVRVAGAVITRQRPGTAKGFVFLTLEDETGIANIIVRPDLFTEQRRDHRRRAVSAGRRDAADPGRRDVGQGRARHLARSAEGPEPQSHDFR